MLKGIDTSHFSVFTLTQLKAMVKKNKLYFNYIKASEGGAVQDQKFVDYWQLSKQAGLLCGAYHFFRPLTNVDTQANNFIKQYNKVNHNGALAPVVDIEWAKSGNGKEQWDQLAVNDRVPAIMKFLDTIETTFHVKPMIYTAPAFWKQFIDPGASAHINTKFAEYPLWVVDLKGTGALPAPWKTIGPVFIQTHFGEQATTPDLFDRTDQDNFPRSTKDLLNGASPGLTFMKGVPASFMVMDMQTKLKALGMLNDNADGVFGNNTDAAVKTFQQANNLFVNGIVDSQTWNKLL